LYLQKVLIVSNLSFQIFFCFKAVSFREVWHGLLIFFIKPQNSEIMEKDKAKKTPKNRQEEIHRDNTNGRDLGNEDHNTLDDDANRPMRDNDSDTTNGRIRFNDNEDDETPQLTEEGKKSITKE
jgi:hypothetical protein